ncbi:MAG: head completion/stabilization protein [Candidatus Accumulibacter sp.]|jgi:hypothetical protein|nr:head completion/stabilization protein [Accumulibacter sp.]
MSFVAAAPAATLPDLPHHPFWPAINPGDCRALMQLDGTVSNPRLIHALTEAVVSVNHDLKAWRLQQTAATLEDVDDDEGQERLPFLYRRAVYETAAADLMERYLRFDATGDAQNRAEQQEPAIEDHRRNAFWAIRDLKGEARSTIELI